MILFRARTLASRPRRHPTYSGNGPDIRVKGRWFTSDIHAAIAHRLTLGGESEIIAIEIPDAIVDSYKVATTPSTPCGIDAIYYSQSPKTDYIVPMTRVMDFMEVDIEGNARRRDYIDVNAPKSHVIRRISIKLHQECTELPLAA